MNVLKLFAGVALILIAYWLYMHFTVSVPKEMMTLTVYVQDVKAAEKNDCAITQKRTFEIPKTSAVADASLKILFDGELKQYGTYSSVAIENGVAKVNLANELPGLSSCQIGHITSVLEDTLMQYPTITKVELYSPKGKIEF